MREAELRGAAVRVLTAHRAKGLEWDLVVVAGVQEGAWPDVRRRGSLLEPDRLSPPGVSELPPTATRIAEERRLFYVACTRARRRLVVTAVAGTEGEGDEPSRFLTELGVPVRIRTRPAAATADLRRPRRRAPPYGDRARRPRPRSARRRPPDWPGCRSSPMTPERRWCRRPILRAGGGWPS